MEIRNYKLSNDNDGNRYLFFPEESDWCSAGRISRDRAEYTVEIWDLVELEWVAVNVWQIFDLKEAERVLINSSFRTWNYLWK